MLSYRHRGLEKLRNLLSSFNSKWQRQNLNKSVKFHFPPPFFRKSCLKDELFKKYMKYSEQLRVRELPPRFRNKHLIHS